MEALLKKVCSRITDRDDSLMNNWHWQQGVALFGLLKANEVLAGSPYNDYIEKWVNERLDIKYPGYSINTMAPLSAALDVYLRTGSQRCLDICDDFVSWCMARAPRCDRGVFEHTCVDWSYPNQVWADTLFMGGIFLAKYSLFTKNKMYMYEALRQYVLHYQFLKADNSSMIIHGFYCDEREKQGVIWGRGNGWFAVGSAIILSLADESYPQYETIKQNFIDFVEELITYQNEDGSFNTVVNEKDSYSEMTATSSFAFAINEGIKLGIIDAKYSVNAKKACDALIRNIEEDGTILNASGGTWVKPDKEDYNAVAVCYSQFAQGLAMLALSSFIK